MPVACPDTAELAAFHTGGLPPADVDRVAAHLEGCAACEAALQAMDAREGPVAAALRQPTPTDLPSAPADRPDGPGTILAGRYKLIEPIGEGGMGTVFLAQQTVPVRRLVALKLVKPGMDSKDVLARFETERQALALMDHPNIARVLDAGTTAAGRPFFVMELVKGVPITKYCDDHKQTTRQRLTLFVDVCRAVQHAHQKGIIHRDLKPSNVLVANDDGVPVPKVIDFGVAKAAGQPLTDLTLVTGFGSVLGTPAYMAPEQAELNQLDVDTRADVYAFGAMLYELLTSTTPLDRGALQKSALFEMLRMIREDDPPRPSTRLGAAATLPAIAAARQTEPRRLTALLRGELDWIVMKALEKDRERRYRTANSLARDVERYLADEPVEARPTSFGYRLQKFLRRHVGATVAAGLVLTVVLIGAGVSLWLAKRATTAEADTRAALEGTKEELASREAVQQFFFDKVIAAGRPEGEEGGLGRDVTLRRAIDAAVPALAEAFRGRPAIEAAVRRVIGQTYLELGDWGLAATQLQMAYRLRKEHLGADHLDTLRSTSELARVYSLLWNKDDAIQLYETALPQLQSRLGDVAPETLQCMTGLADAYHRGARFDDGARLNERALALSRAARGPDDSLTLEIMNGLAAIYRDLGRTSDAIALSEEIVRVRRAKLGPDRPDTVSALHGLAIYYGDAGRFADAIRIFEEIVPLRKAQIGPAHPDTFQTMYSLGTIYQWAGRHDDAVRVRRECVAVFQTKPMATATDIAGRMHELAITYLYAGRPDDAIATFQQIESLAGAAGKPEDVPGRLLWLATAHQAAGRADDARPKFAEAVSGLRRLGPEDPRFAKRLADSAAVLLQYREFGEAEPRLREALAIAERQEPDVWNTAHVRSLLGAALAGQGKTAEAEPLLLAGFAGLQQRVAQKPVEIRRRLWEAAGRLVAFYDAAGRPAEAEKWRAEQARIMPAR